MDRRDFLRLTGAAGLGMVAPSAFSKSKPDASAPQAKGKSVADLHLPPLETVRFGIIGVGARGPTHVNSILNIEGAEIKAICDLYPDWAARSAKKIVDAGQPEPTLYTGGEQEFKKLNRRDDIDAVVIATPWEWHVPMAIDAMRNGKHALIEVPAALTVEECWQLVDVAEETQRHCMMLENVNYGRDELLLLNMARMGVFGDLLHGEAAYIHDLRGQMNQVNRGTGSWRTVHYQTTNGNLYPTHGLGPVADYMGVNRGDRFDYMSSMGSPSMMRNIYAEENFPEDHKWNKTEFVCADINTSMIKTKKGRSIMVQWDEQLPRPYTRHNYLQGTKGAWAGFPNRVVLEGVTESTHSWVQGADLAEWYEKYDHPLYRAQGELAKTVGGHGGMDFLMMWRIVYCLQNGEPLDQDVYDAAAWSVVTPLSVWSVANRSDSIDFPDFTRGQWEKRKPMPIFDPKK